MDGLTGDLEKVDQGHRPSQGTKRLPRCAYLLNMTFRDEVIMYQRVWDGLTGDLEKVGQGQWPSKGTKRLPRCAYLLNMKVL